MSSVTVKQGDTLNSISQSLGYENYKDAGVTSVPSGDFDLIRPGEVINFGRADDFQLGGSGPSTATPMETIGDAGTVPYDAITTDSSAAIGEENALGDDINSLRDMFGIGSYDEFTSANIDPLTALQDEQSTFIQEQRDALAARRASAVSGINAGFDATKQQTEFQQKRETGGTAQGLARAGGYLGVTGSHAGVLQNLAVTHRQELTALEAQRQAAINQANNAFEDRDFELAQEMLTGARELETEIFNRQQTFFNTQLDIMGEQRARNADQRADSEFSYRMATDRINDFLDFGDVPTADDIRSMALESGRTETELLDLFKASKAARELDVKDQKTDREIAILSVLQDIPNSQSIKLDGVEYQGMKDPLSSGTGGTATERENSRIEGVKSDFMSDIASGDVTREDAILYYPELDSKYIEAVFSAIDSSENREEATANIESGDWAIVQFAGEDPTIYNKNEYDQAITDFKTDLSKAATFWGDDEDFEYAGKTYRVPKKWLDGKAGERIIDGKVPSPADFEVLQERNIRY